jgi:acyl transferase domain-containing protein
MTWENGLRLVALRSRVISEHLQPAAVAAVTAGEVDAVAPSHGDPLEISSDSLDAFERFADTIDYFPADRPLICNLSGKVAPVHQLLGGSYWKRHLAEPVQLNESIQTLAQQDCQLFLEIGPSSSLGQFAASQWPAEAPQFMATLCQGENENACVLNALGQMYVGGVMADFAAVDQPWPHKKIHLPTYPFDRSRYWITDVSKYANKK